MAFIPVALPTLGNPIAEGLDKITAARQQEKIRQQQENLQRAQMLMQQRNIDADNARADQEMLLQKAQFDRTGKNQQDEQTRQGAEIFGKIYEASGHDPEFARQLAKAHGYEIVDSPGGPIAVQAPQAPAPQPGPPAVPAPPPPPGTATSPPPQPNPSIGGGGPFMAGPPQLAPGQQAPLQQDAPQQLPQGHDGLEPFPGPTPPQPTQSQLDAVAAKQNPILKAFMLRKQGRPDLLVDPNAAKAAEEAKFAEQLQLKAAAPQMRIDATSSENEKKRQFLLDHPELRNERVTIEDRDRWAKMAADARMMGMREMAENPLKVEASDRQAVSALERAHQDLTRNAQYTALVKENRTVQKVFSNIADGTEPLQHKDAMIQLGRFFREAQPTEGEMHLLYNNLGGTMDKWNQFVEKLLSGDISEEQLRQLRASAKTVKAEHDKFVNDYANAFRARFPEGGAYGNMKNELDSLYRADLAGMGIENPPSLFPAEQQQAGPQLAAPGTARRKKTNPIVNAAKTSKLSPEDKAAVDWAKAHPNDPSAAEILRVNGL